jgi:hypothetical protein
MGWYATFTCKRCQLTVIHEQLQDHCSLAVLFPSTTRPTGQEIAEPATAQQICGKWASTLSPSHYVRMSKNLMGICKTICSMLCRCLVRAVWWRWLIYVRKQHVVYSWAFICLDAMSLCPSVPSCRQWCLHARAAFPDSDMTMALRITSEDAQGCFQQAVSKYDHRNGRQHNVGKKLVWLYLLVAYEYSKRPDQGTDVFLQESRTRGDCETSSARGIEKYRTWSCSVKLTHTRSPCPALNLTHSPPSA